MIKVVVVCFPDGSTIHFKADFNVMDKINKSFEDWNNKDKDNLYKGMRAGMIEIDMLEKDYLKIVRKTS